MYRDEADLVWLVPLFLAAFFLIGAAGAWWRVCYGKRVGDVELKPSAGDLRQAAFASSCASLLLALSILTAFWVRG